MNYIANFLVILLYIVFAIIIIGMAVVVFGFVAFVFSALLQGCVAIL